MNVEDLAHSSVWVLSLDREGRVRELNAGAAWALSPGIAMAEAFPAQADALIVAITRVVATKTPAAVEVCRDKSGVPNWVHLELAPKLSRDGAVEGISAVGFDVTARKAAEENLRRIESMMVDTQGVAHLGTWDWDITQPAATWSAELYRIYGLTPESYSPSYENYLTKVHPDDRAHVRLATERVFREHVPYSHDERILRADGTVRYLHTWAYPVLDAAGVLKRLIGVCQDVTDRKTVEIELAQRATELAEANLRLRTEMNAREVVERKLRQSLKLEAIGRLAGGIAHDFNNLLGVIVARSSIVIADLASNSVQRESMDEIISTARNAARLTQQLLTFSRGQRASREVIDLRGVVQDLTEIFRSALGKNVELVLKFDDLAPYVTGDRSQLDQVVMNLLVNAREAMPDGGRITLELVASRAAGLTNPEDLEASLDCVVLRVSDTGIGMDEAVQARIFDPYFTTKAAGTGLGLSTSFGIVKQSGGALTVSSEPGRGASFSVFLPRALGVTSVRREPAAVRKPATVKRVLLVEDQDHLRRSTRILLENEGYQVLEAADPDEALVLADRDPRTIDLLLTDIVMPKINGLELAQRIRKLRSGIRILYVSGWADGRVISAAKLEAPLLPKPFTSQELAAAVAHALDDQPLATTA